jgi:hypothetical protein
LSEMLLEYDRPLCATSIDAALETCHLRGWAEPLENAVPEGNLAAASPIRFTTAPALRGSVAHGRRASATNAAARQICGTLGLCRFSICGKALVD